MTNDNATGETDMAAQLKLQNNVRPMAESRKRRVEVGLLAVQEAEHEAAEFKRLLDEVTTRNAALTAELSATQVALGRQQTEIEEYRRERDNAVAKRAEVEALFDAVRTLMNNRRMPSVAEETEPPADDEPQGGGA